MQAPTLFGRAQKSQSEGNSLASPHVYSPTLLLASYWPVSPHSQSWQEELAEVGRERHGPESLELTLMASLDARAEGGEAP